MAISAWSLAALILVSFAIRFAYEWAALSASYLSRYAARSLSLRSSSMRLAFASAYFSCSFLRFSACC